MRLSAGIIALLLTLTGVWVGECGGKTPPARRGEVRPNPIGGRRDRASNGRGERDGLVGRSGVYEGLRRRGDDDDDDEGNNLHGSERRKSMKADRGRRLASGDRERALLNRNRPSLSTSYGGRKRGSKPRSRRSASSSEEHRFYSDDDEFEHEEEELHSDDVGNEFSDEEEPWGQVGSGRIHTRGHSVPSRRGGRKLGHHPERRGRLVSSSSRRNGRRGTRNIEPSQYSSLLTDLSATMRDRLAQAKEDASGRVQEWKNLYKCKMSSQFERYMLQLTWPDDNAVGEPFVRDVVRHLEYDDGYYSAKDKRNPFRRTLRKIWSRMKERDYRSVLKAIFVLHRMCYDLSPRAAKLLYDHFRCLRREFDNKNQREQYFTTRRVLDLSSCGEVYMPFVKAYYGFTVQRLRILGPLGRGRGSPLQLLVNTEDGGQENDGAAPVVTEKDAVALLMQIGNLIDAASSCVVPKSLLRPLIASLMDFCAVDVSEIWKGYVAGVEIIAGKAPFPVEWDRSEAGAASRESRASLLQSTISTQDCLKDYLAKVHQLMSGKRSKRNGRKITGDVVLPVSLNVQELESCAAAILRGEEELDGQVKEEAKVEDLEELQSHSAAQDGGVHVVNKEKPSSFAYMRTDGTADVQEQPYVHKAEEELHHDATSNNEGKEEEESHHPLEQPDDDLLTSIGMFDYDEEGVGLEKEIGKSGDVVTKDLYEDPECEDDSADP